MIDVARLLHLATSLIMTAPPAGPDTGLRLVDVNDLQELLDAARTVARDDTMGELLAPTADPRTLVPPGCPIEPEDERGLSVWGAENLGRMAEYWLAQAALHQRRVSALSELLWLVGPDGRSQIPGMRARFDSPEFTLDAAPGPGGAPHPIAAQALLLDRGSTTLSMCGWCAYATGGQVNEPYNYRAACACSVRLAAGFAESARDFNSPCTIDATDTALMDQLVEGIGQSVMDSSVQAALTEQRAFRLQTLAAEADHRPLLASLRHRTYLSPGDGCVVHQSGAEVPWVAGHVVAQDPATGYVHVCSRSPLKGDESQATAADYLFVVNPRAPTVLHAEDLSYLTGNPVYARAWVAAHTGADQAAADAFLNAVLSLDQPLQGGHS